MRAGGRGPERGAVLIVVALLLVVLIGFGSLVVDLGKLYKVRGELQNASDSASHAAAQELDRSRQGIERARDRAREYARLHLADETPVELADEDIIFGHYDEATDTFTPLGADPANPAAVNAVRVVDRRAGGTGNPVVLHLAPVLGIERSDVDSSAIAVGGGPQAECGFPMVVPDCALDEALSGETCDYCMLYQDNNTDNAGWTSFDSGSVGGPAIATLIEDACFDEAGNVAVDPETGECTGVCRKTQAGDQVKVQNGNLMNSGANNFCPLIQEILTRGVEGGTPQPFTVRVPVLKSTGETCDASQFSSFKEITGYAAMEIFGAKCSNADPGVIAPSAPCPPPPSGKFVVAELRCDLDSFEGPAGGGYFGIDARRIRLVR